MAEAGKILSPPAGRQQERPDQKLNVIGTRMLRKEDPRFLIGRGRLSTTSRCRTWRTRRWCAARMRTPA